PDNSGSSDSSDAIDSLIEDNATPVPMPPGDASIPSPSDDDKSTPDEMELPTPEGEEAAEANPEAIELSAQPTANWDEVPAGPDLPAPMCSSRNLLFPGCFYASADVVYMTRVGRRTDRILGADFGGAFGANLLVTDRGLGFSPGTKLTIGKFLGRDCRNRDYNVEFSYFGLFDWNQEKGLNSVNNSASIESILDAAGVIPDYHNSVAQQYDYKSQSDSFETNLRISRRLPRDRMELQPNGNWIRVCDPDLLPTFMVGLRTVHVDEQFGYFAQGLNAAQTNGTYIVNTSNELYGVQSGVELMYQQCKWRVGGRFKNGIYVNFAEQDSFVRIVDLSSPAADPADRREKATTDVLSWLGELNVEAVYNVRPNLAVRAGYEITMINETALAVKQLTFSPETPANIVTGGFL